MLDESRWISTPRDLPSRRDHVFRVRVSSMRKITAVATCTALAVALAACGEKPKPATNQVSSQQRAQIDKARATLADQRATLEADQTALAARKANAVADITKT